MRKGSRKCGGGEGAVWSLPTTRLKKIAPKHIWIRRELVIKRAGKLRLRFFFLQRRLKLKFVDSCGTTVNKAGSLPVRLFWVSLNMLLQ